MCTAFASMVISLSRKYPFCACMTEDEYWKLICLYETVADGWKITLFDGCTTFSFYILSACVLLTIRFRWRRWSLTRMVVHQILNKYLWKKLTNAQEDHQRTTVLVSPVSWFEFVLLRLIWFGPLHCVINSETVNWVESSQVKRQQGKYYRKKKTPKEKHAVIIRARHVYFN